MCEIEIGQVGPGKFPILSYSRKLNMALESSESNGNWTQIEGCGVLATEKRNLVCFFHLKKQCYERYFNKWVFFPENYSFSLEIFVWKCFH